MEVHSRDRFCGHCGTTLAEHVKPAGDVFSVLTPSLTYYFVTLGLLATYKLTDLFPVTFESYLVVSTLDMLIVIVFWTIAWQEVRPLLSFRGFKFSIAALVIMGALGGCLVVSIVADYINVSLFESTYSDSWMFVDTAYPLVFSILLTCAQPAIFEEVAFRGFLFNNIQKISTPSGATYLTAFIFGIIHLSIISMLWLVPIGLAFAFLRVKYNTLWYGVIGHFTYNLGFALLDYWEMAY
ncbi:MAG TPA: type II CAAX endopeptidase family protein [Cyclobacteriaceae bacterium]|nr:type II CAAX endopeptidase family protein [Cyclobacteriaceae bacterium]